MGCEAQLEPLAAQGITVCVVYKVLVYPILRVPPPVRGALARHLGVDVIGWMLTAAKTRLW